MANTMKELLVDNLRDLFNAENQLAKALPKLARKASSPMLAEAIENHLAETEEQIERLREVFELLDERPGGKHCAGMEGLIEEGREAMEHEVEAVRDAAIIVAAQKVEHYEMAGYGCCIAYAELLELSDVVSILNETLEEEKAADEKLNEIAENEVNPQALLEGGDEEMEDEDEDDEEMEYEEEEEYETADR
jgi:ferritin-like metal-binding protein YciE